MYMMVDENKEIEMCLNLSYVSLKRAISAAVICVNSIPSMITVVQLCSASEFKCHLKLCVLITLNCSKSRTSTSHPRNIS